MATDFKDFEGFLRSAIKFETQHERELKLIMTSPIHKRKIAIIKLIAVGLIRYTAIKGGPFLFGVLTVVFPFLTINLLSFYPGKFSLDILDIFTQTNGWIHKVWKNFLIATLNGIVWGSSVKVAMTCLIQILLGAVSMPAYICIITSEIQNWRNSKRIMGCRESEVNTTSMTFMYRKIQLIVESYNRIHSKILISILLLYVSSLVIWAVKFIQFLLIGKFGDPTFLAMSFLVIQTIIHASTIIILLYGTCGNVHDESTKCLVEMRWSTFHSGSSYRRKLVLMEVKSLPVLKIEFGASNFIEKTTSIVFLQFALEKIVDCLLLSK
ncbi:unnamed protein product [Orchesella dallaii]|uniref:Odorant receptor n=1 Tax=Orchesella dallaii TaxID=48710 RepID=A0ABP1S981_9HEXA